jgi:hypothetical protein
MKKVNVKMEIANNEQPQKDNTNSINRGLEDYSNEIYNLLGQIGDYISGQGKILIHPSVELLDSDYFLYWCEIYRTVNNNEQLAIEFYEELERITTLTGDEFIIEFIEYICPCIDDETGLHNHIYSV